MGAIKGREGEDEVLTKKIWKLRWIFGDDSENPKITQKVGLGRMGEDLFSWVATCDG